MLRKILCYFGFHDYTDWGERIVTRYGDVQTRTCKYCHYIQERSI
jgi:hypothetical protein